VRELGKFYPAEDYHRDYYKLNPLQPYCMLVIRPKVRKIRGEFGV
jgi:Peptide methionine sulfoxide reductase